VTKIIAIHEVCRSVAEVGGALSASTIAPATNSIAADFRKAAAAAAPLPVMSPKATLVIAASAVAPEGTLSSHKMKWKIVRRTLTQLGPLPGAGCGAIRSPRMTARAAMNAQLSAIKKNLSLLGRNSHFRPESDTSKKISQCRSVAALPLAVSTRVAGVWSSDAPVGGEAASTH
jgi:hypothetical protein